MTTTRRVRPICTPGPGRILAAVLILSALLAAAPPPAEAQPARWDSGPLAGLLSWFEGLLADLGFAPEGSETGPKAAFLPEGCSADPGGAPCSQGLNAPKPAALDAEIDRPTPPVEK